MMLSVPLIPRGSLRVWVGAPADTFRDARQVPHLVLWGIMAGCLWAVGNTLTIFAVRDIGLSLAFPLWNSNSLIGILWGTLLFRELQGAGWLRKAGVIGGGGGGFFCAPFFSAGPPSPSPPWD